MQIPAKAFVLALKTVYFFFKLFLKPQNKILLLSRQSDTPSVDFVLLNEKISNSCFDGQIKILTKKIPSGILGKIGYGFHILSQMYHIATAKVIIVDGYSIAVSVLNHKKGQKIVQIWHALNIVKKFGCAALDKPWGHSSATANTMCMHRNYDYYIACSEIAADVLSECFNTEREKAVLTGLPRIDYILNSPEKVSEIKEVYPEVFNKPILLYVPTFRGEKVDLSWIEETVDLEKYNVVVKLHPSDKLGLDTFKNKDLICDGNFSSFDWMKVCDKIITDYSGIGFEAMLLGKKVYFYLYDYKEYSVKNGLAVDLFSESISPFVTQNKKQLRKILESEYDYSLQKSYLEKYLNVSTQDCAEHLALFILSLLEV